MPNYISAIIEKAGRHIQIKEFLEGDYFGLAKMSDKDLAAWQAGFREDTPNWILANYEWQRRLLRIQNNATMRAAFLGLLGTVLGTIIGFILGKWF